MTKPHPMEQFHDLIRRILSEGVRRPNRTGVDTLYVAGASLEFNLMEEGFPAITSKKLAFKSAVRELLGMFRGYTSAAQFRDIGCPVWNQNANETKEWLASPYREDFGGTDAMGRTYPAQWTDWKDTRVEPKARAEQMIAEKGYTLIGHGLNGEWIVQRSINQLEDNLRQVLTNPYSRRILLSGWNVGEMDMMCLPPCHVSYQLILDPEKRVMDLQMYQRSFDVGLGFNVTLAALYLSLMARLSNYTPRRVKMDVGDCHIYVTHEEGLREMITREHFAQPTLHISDEVRPVTVDEIPGVFTRIEPAHLSLVGYQHHPAVKLPMAS